MELNLLELLLSHLLLELLELLLSHLLLNLVLLVLLLLLLLLVLMLLLLLLLEQLLLLLLLLLQLLLNCPLLLLDSPCLCDKLGLGGGDGHPLLLCHGLKLCLGNGRHGQWRYKSPGKLTRNCWHSPCWNLHWPSSRAILLRYCELARNVEP